MRKFYLIIAIALLGVSSLQAQISQGGLPFSFQKSANLILQANVPTQSMPTVDVGSLKAEDALNVQNKEIPWRFGYNIPVNIDVKTQGAMDILSNGYNVWRLRIYSQGAYTINLAFNKYHLPAGAKLFIYNEQRTHVLGAFTNSNNQADNVFASTLIDGETIILEYAEPQVAEFSGELNIERVTHGYRNVYDFAAKNFGTSGSCQINVACPEGIGWENEIRSACLLVVGGSGFCSGALINNTANDGTPYVLTANHCSTSNDFASWVFWFNWQSPTCTNPTTSPAHNETTASGCVLKARNAGSDFCLVKMNATSILSNFNVYYAGWSNSTAAAPSATCIHFPDCDMKKISPANTTMVSATYSNADCWQANWTSAACTEPGSSGSPLFDKNHLIIGQLYGGPSACGVAASSMNDYYGKFSTSWNTGTTSATRLKEWLDPSNSGVVSIAGYDPNTPTTALDARPLLINAPTATYCGSQNIVPSVTIKNVGTTTLTSLLVKYNIDGGALIQQSWTGSLATNATATVTFPQITLTSGSHTIKAITNNPNAAADENTANDTLTSSYTVISGIALPFAEGFEGSTFAPTGWTINNPNANFTWARTTNIAGNTPSTAAAYMAFFGTTNSTSGHKDELVSPAISLNGIVTAQLTFKVAYKTNSGATSRNDSMRVYISTDCGSTYTSIYYKGGATLSTGAAISVAFFPTLATEWRTETIDLTAYSGQNFILKFVGINRRGNNLFLDDINIINTSPTGKTVSGILTYNNSANTAMSSVTVNLMNGTSTVATGTTDVNGSFSFTGIPDGAYTFTASSTKVWGGVTATDALKIKRHIAGLELLTEPIRLTSADVNVSASITSTDVLLVQRRLAGLITSFTSADWIFEKPGTGGNALTVAGNDLTQNFYAICSADVNGTYVPAFFMKKANVTLEPTSQINILNNSTFEIPLKVSQNTEIGAMQLFIDYPSDLVEVVGVTIPDQQSELIYSAKNGQLKVIWTSLNPLKLERNDILLSVIYKPIIKNFIGDVSISLNNESELANGEGTVIDEAIIYSNSVKLVDAALGINLPNTENNINVYPNPTTGKLYIDTKNINFASIEIKDIIGRIIYSKENVSNSISINMNEYPRGMYFITMKSESKNYTQKIILKD